MELYFSGVQSHQERRWMNAAHVGRIQVDPREWVLQGKWLQAGGYQVALDSGAEAIWEECRTPRPPSAYAEWLDRIGVERFDFIMSLDVVGDPVWSRANYEWLRAAGYPVVPVWEWDGPPADLAAYLESSPRVAIRGIGRAYRYAQDSAEKRVLVRAVRDLAAAHPARLHLMGLASPDLFEATRQLALSASTDAYKQGARRWLCWQVRERIRGGEPTGETYITRAPARRLDEFRTLTRSERCAHNARVLNQYLNQSA